MRLTGNYLWANPKFFAGYLNAALNKYFPIWRPENYPGVPQSSCLKDFAWVAVEEHSQLIAIYMILTTRARGQLLRRTFQESEKQILMLLHHRRQRKPLLDPLSPGLPKRGAHRVVG